LALQADPAWAVPHWHNAQKIEHFFFAVAAKLVCVPEFAAVIGVVPEVEPAGS
jgi:hypothetical protein